MQKMLFLVTAGDIGGAGKHVLLSAQKLKREGFDVIVGTREPGWLSGELKKNGIATVFFKNLRRSLNPIFSLFFIFELRKFLKRERVDVINFNSSNPLPGLLGLFGLEKRPKTVFTVHGWSYLSPGFKKSKIAKVVVWLSMKFFLPMIDEIIFVCNYDKELAEKMGLVKKDRGKVIYNQVGEINFLSREQARKELKIPENKIVVGTITRLEYAKNNEMLIEAISRTSKEIVCLIIGSGPDEKNLKFKIKNLKLEDKVFLLGNIPDASKYLRAFDVFVMTSRYEGMPYALLEALAAGVPIIATRVGGIPEVLEGKGILIEPGNIDLLSRCLQNDHYCSEKN